MNNDMIDQNLGRGILKGEDPTVNHNIARNVSRWLTKKMSSGASTKRSTQDLLEQGKKAKPAVRNIEEEILESGLESGQPPADVPQGDAIEGEHIPAGGMTREDAGAVIDDATKDIPSEENNFEMPDRGSMSAEDYVKKTAEIQTEKLDSRTWVRNVNLDYLDSAEDIGRALEVGADMIPEAERQSLASIQAQVDAGEAVDILKDVLVSKPAALSSTQLLAGRQVLVTMAEDLEKMAAKIVAGEGSPELLLKFEKHQGQMVMIQEYMQGKIREAGRALNSMKIVAQAVNSGTIEQMARNADGKGSVLKAQQVLDMKEAGSSTGEVIQDMARMSKLKNFTSALVNYRNASILTGFKTQAVNLISNANYAAVSSMAIKPLAAMIGRTRSAITGNNDRVYLAEAVSEMTAFQQGLGDAIRMGAKVWKEGTFDNGGEYMSSFGGRKIDETVDNSPLMGTAMADLVPGGQALRYTGVPQALDSLQRVTESISYGLLTASDEFFKSVAYRKSLYSSATRQAYMEGVDDPAARANELLNNVTKEMHDDAVKFAEEQTFTNQVNGKVLQIPADAIVKMGQAFPPVRLVIPFVRTPTAIFDRSIKLSPLAPIQKEFYTRISKGGAEADMALAEMTFGVSLATLFYTLYQSDAIKGENAVDQDGIVIQPGGVLTGMGPGYDSKRDSMQRKAMEATGWQGVSVRAGDGTYVSIQRGMEPFSTPLIGMLNYMDKIAYAQTETEASDLFAGAALAMAKHFKDNTYMQGLADLLDLMDGKINKDSYAARQVASLVPSLLRDVRSIEKGLSGVEETPYIPRSNNFWELLDQELKYRLPGTENRAIKRYWDGSAVVAGGGEALYLYNSVSPVRVSRIMGAGPGREYDYANERLAANGVAPSQPTSEIGLESETGIKVDLLDLKNGVELYDRLLIEVGKVRRQAVEAVINDASFENLTAGPGREQQAVLEKALSEGLLIGKGNFLAWLAEEDLDPEVYGEAAALLSPANLSRLVKDYTKGRTTDEETDLLGKQGMKGVEGRGELYVPRL